LCAASVAGRRRIGEEYRLVVVRSAKVHWALQTAISCLCANRKGEAVELTLFTSAFCEPCMQTRAVLAEAARLVPEATVTELDVVRFEERAAAEGIRSTPTVIVRDKAGAEVVRAEGVPTVQQVLVAAAKAI
jgi:thiol-disulfide isomerase/thioredoxin